jgi:NAD-dependent SIR2 family protein deacetylase
MPIELCKEMVFKNKEPTCRECGGLVKPDIVFFGEELPSRFQQLVNDDVDRCDLLVVIGTSLLVMPVAGIPSWVSPNCPRILLNRELVGDFAHAAYFGGGNRDRDVFLEGDCDDGVQKLCKLTGWHHDLENCYESLHSKR